MDSGTISQKVQSFYEQLNSDNKKTPKFQTIIALSRWAFPPIGKPPPLNQDQIDLLLCGTDSKSDGDGICKIIGLKKKSFGGLKRSSKQALEFLYKLLFQSGPEQKKAARQVFLTLDPDIYCEMQLATHAQAGSKSTSQTNQAIEIIILIRKKRPHVSLKDCFNTHKEIEIIRKVLLSYKPKSKLEKNDQSKSDKKNQGQGTNRPEKDFYKEMQDHIDDFHDIDKDENRISIKELQYQDPKTWDQVILAEDQKFFSIQGQSDSLTEVQNLSSICQIAHTIDPLTGEKIPANADDKFDPQLCLQSPNFNPKKFLSAYHKSISKKNLTKAYQRISQNSQQINYTAISAIRVRKNLNQFSAAKMAMDKISKQIFSSTSPSTQAQLQKIEEKLTTIKIISKTVSNPLQQYLHESDKRLDELKQFALFSKFV